MVKNYETLHNDNEVYGLFTVRVTRIHGMEVNRVHSCFACKYFAIFN